MASSDLTNVTETCNGETRLSLIGQMFLSTSFEHISLLSKIDVIVLHQNTYQFRALLIQGWSKASGHRKIRFWSERYRFEFTSLSPMSSEVSTDPIESSYEMRWCR